MSVSNFDAIEDGELMWVVENPEEAERCMKENGGKFSGTLRPMIKNPEVFKLIVIPPDENPDNVWSDVLARIKKEKINVRSDIFERTKKWKSYPIRYFAAVYNQQTGDAPVMALLSQKTAETGLWINLITTNSPLMPRPYTSMLQRALHEFAREKLGVELFVPKEYKVSDAAPITVDNLEGGVLEDCSK